MSSKNILKSRGFNPKKDNSNNIRDILSPNAAGKPIGVDVPDLSTTEAAALETDSKVKDRLRQAPAITPPPPMEAPSAPVPEAAPASRLSSMPTPEKRATETMVEFASKVPDLTNPTRVSEVYAYMDKKFEELDSKDSSWMQQQASKLKAAQDEIKKEYGDQMSRTAKFELADILGQAMVQLGYAFTTIKTGQDFKGALPLNKTDWSKAYDRLLNERKQSMSEAKDTSDSETAIQKDSSDKRYDSARRKIGMAASLYEDNVRAGRRRAEELSKSDKPIDLTKEVEKINSDFRQVESFSARYREAKTDKERTSLMGQVFIKLKQPENTDQLTVEELQTLEDEKRKFSSFFKGLFNEQPDKFQEYVNNIKKVRLQSLGLSDSPPASEQASAPVPSTGYTLMVDPETGETDSVINSEVEKAKSLGLKVK